LDILLRGAAFTIIDTLFRRLSCTIAPAITIVSVGANICTTLPCVFLYHRFNSMCVREDMTTSNALDRRNIQLFSLYHTTYRTAACHLVFLWPI
jgi:hypothetical protein